jgi:hypothetical protein
MRVVMLICVMRIGVIVVIMVTHRDRRIRLGKFGGQDLRFYRWFSRRGWRYDRYERWVFD